MLEYQMSMFSLPYGHGCAQVALEADLILPREAESAGDETEAVREALRRPIGAPPLEEIVRPGETVAIVVNDVTRLARTDLMLPPIVDALNRAGVPDRDVLVVFALGTHRKQTKEEQRRIIGDAMFRRLAVLDHDAFDARELVTLGATSFGNTVEINRRVWECDRIVVTGEIIFHMIAGYSGGRKSLVPGVAGERTITFNHRMILDPRCVAGVLDGNPAHEDMLEGARMAAPDFMVNLVLGPSRRLACAVAGHFEAAHRAGCRAADQALCTPIGEPYDIVVASAGGDPLDIDLRQAHKHMENAARALRPGGTLFFYAECPNGAGFQPIEDFLFRYPDAAAMEEALRRDFVVGGHKAYWLARMGRNYRVHLVSNLDPKLVERCGFTHVPPAEHESALRRVVAEAGQAARVAVIPRAGFTVPTQTG